MNKTIRTIAAITLLGVTVCGCQKEESLPMQQMQIETPATVYEASYTVDGVIHHQTVPGRQALLELIRQLTALAREGHSVCVWNSAYADNGRHAKEVVTFSTRDKAEADAWTLMMILKGYEVSVTVKDGVYVCTATN